MPGNGLIECRMALSLTPKVTAQSQNDGHMAGGVGGGVEQIVEKLPTLVGFDLCGIDFLELVDQQNQRLRVDVGQRVSDPSQPFPLSVSLLFQHLHKFRCPGSQCLRAGIDTGEN